MTDSRNDAQSFPPVFQDAERWIWELGAESTAFPLSVQSGAKDFEIYVHLKPYTPETLISVLNAAPGTYRRQQRDVEVVAVDDSVYGQLIDPTFVRIEGVSSNDPSIQKKWLDQNPMLKARIAKECLGGLEVDETMPSDVPATEEERLELLPIALDCAEVNVSTTQKLYDPLTKRKVQVRVVHRMRAETESDWRKWQRTGNEKYVRGQKQWQSTVNWWQRVAMYDDMVLSIDGMAHLQQLCTAETKAGWLKKVPAWHKFLIITTMFDEQRIKNG